MPGPPSPAAFATPDPEDLGNPPQRTAPLQTGQRDVIWAITSVAVSVGFDDAALVEQEGTGELEGIPFDLTGKMASEGGA